MKQIGVHCRRKFRPLSGWLQWQQGSLLNYKRIAYIRKASTNTKEFLECHTQHDSNTGGRKNRCTVVFFDYVLWMWLLETSCIWEEAVFMAVDVDWCYEGTYLDAHWFTRRILGTPVLCTTQLCGLISSLMPN